MEDTPIAVAPPSDLPPRPPSAAFRCSESIGGDENAYGDEDDDDVVVGSVTFRCTLPPDGSRTLSFGCRDASCGVLVGDEKSAADARGDGDAESAEEEECAVDPNFFDAGYTLAGRTGFQVWAATRLTIDALTFPRRKGGDSDGDGPTDEDGERLAHWQRRVSGGGLRALELGSGVGVVGASLAAGGAEVLLTDLPTLVENATGPNLVRNAASAIAPCGDQGGADGEADGGASPSWLRLHGPVRIGGGWAAAAPLDWTRPFEAQLSDLRDRGGVDVVIASDCVWLISMLESLLSTVEAVFSASASRPSPPSFLLSFQRRDPKDGDESALFASVGRVMAKVKKRGWSVQCLAWHPLRVNDKEQSEVYLFEILSQKP